MTTPFAIRSPTSTCPWSASSRSGAASRRSSVTPRRPPEVSSERRQPHHRQLARGQHLRPRLPPLRGKRHGRWFAVWSLYVESLRSVWASAVRRGRRAAPSSSPACTRCGRPSSSLLVGHRERDQERRDGRIVHVRELLHTVRLLHDPVLRGAGPRAGVSGPAIPGPAALFHQGVEPFRLHPGEARRHGVGALRGLDRADDRPLRGGRADEAGHSGGDR